MPEFLVLAGLLVLSVLGLVFMDALVAQPKLLFGRSLSALAPSLFPKIVMTLLALLCAILLILLRQRGYLDPRIDSRPFNWTRATAFFGIMLVYALTMEPLGFLISSFIAVVALSSLMGSRSIVQIGIVSIAAPVLLYLAATRLLAVSLPELNSIELFYAKMLGG